MMAQDSTIFNSFSCIGRLMRILIRKAKKGDAEGKNDVFNEGLRRGLYKYTGGNAPTRSKENKALDKRISRNKEGFFFVAVDKETGRIVGYSGFHTKDRGRTRHRGELNWMVHPDYLKKGIGTRLLKAVLKEAKRCGFKRAEAEVATKNVASIRLAKRCGMKIEGQRSAGLVLDDGTYVDTYLFGKMLR